MSNPILPGSEREILQPETMDLPPWRDQSSWAQVISFFKFSCREKILKEPVWYAGQIAQRMAIIDELFGDLCRQTCPGCKESCCHRATIWYDFNDLLFCYLYRDDLPLQQIVKKRGEACPLLTPAGCSLPRLERPFICTWYVCPAQTTIIEQYGSTDPVRKIYSTLREMQSARQLLENSFVQSVTG